MLKIHAPSTTVRVGDIVQLPLTCTEPGDVVITSSDESVAVASTPVTIAGTRTWGNMGSGGMYLARAGSEGNGRSNVTFFLKFDTSKTLPMTKGSAIGAYTWVPLMASVNMTPYNRINWSIALRCYSDVIIVYYVQSASSAAAEVGYAFSSLPLSGENKIALVLDAGDAGNQNVILYRNERASAQTVTRAVTTGTMDGSEALIWHSGMHCSKISRKASDAELDAWFSSETIPASNREFMFSGGHEIDKSAPVIWDTSGIATPLDLDDTLTVTRWHAPSMRGDYTDSVPVVPYGTISISPLSAGTTTITARRRRAGVPDRASDGEKYEVDTCLLTVDDALVVEQATVQLMIYASVAGTATIAMDNPIIDFPASVAVVEGKNQVSGIATGSGACNVTVTMNGSSSVTTFNIDAIPLNLNIGPETTLDYEGLPITFKMIASCDHFDKTVNLSTTGVGITVPPTVYLNGAPVEFEVTVDGFGEYSVTGEVDGETSTAFIHSVNDEIELYLEADKDIHTKDLPITFNMRVFCDRDGEVALAGFGGGITVPDTVDVVGGVAEFEVEITTEGLKWVTATFDTAFAECSLNISEEAYLISLGEDRHIYYFGDEITIQKTIFCNKDGVVNLSSSGTEMTFPASVSVVDGTAEFDVVFNGELDEVLTAAHVDEPLVEAECRIIVENAPSRVLHIGPDQTVVMTEDDVEAEIKYILVMVATDFPGTVSLSSSSPSISVPASVYCDGRVFVSVEATEAAEAIITASKDGLTSTCRIIVTAESGGGCPDCNDCSASDDTVWSPPEDREVDSTMFVGGAEKDFSKQIAEELMEKVVNQVVFYYPVDVQATNYHPIYGESITKKFHPPVRVYALVEWKGYDTKNASFSLDKVPVIEVHFAKRRLEEDQGLVVKEGDFIKYGRDFYEITALNENAELFGAFNNKVDVSATCVKARKGTFHVEDQTFSKDTDFQWDA